MADLTWNSVARFFNVGGPIEISSNEEGFAGSWFAGILIRPSRKRPNKVVVKYSTIFEDDEGTIPAKDVLEVSQIRPPPPAVEELLTVGSNVDAFYHDGWWEGVIFKVVKRVGEDRCGVFFRHTREKRWFPTSKVRRHREWVDGQWLPAVEPLVDDRVPKVEPVDHAPADWGRNRRQREPSVERLDLTPAEWDRVRKHRRQVPKEEPQVDATADGVEPLVDEPTDGVRNHQQSVPNEELLVHAPVNGVRTHRQRVPAVEPLVDVPDDGDTPPHPPPKKIKVEDNNFCPGKRVEYSSHEEGFKGSYYVATVVEKTEGKYIIEHRNLCVHEESNVLLTEEVDGLNLRPSPPVFEMIDGFELHDQVDAWYNDGWWVGTVTKILKNDRYSVYFPYSMEESKFDHSKLRVHQDWRNGKWHTAPKVLSL